MLPEQEAEIIKDYMARASPDHEAGFVGVYLACRSGYLGDATIRPANWPRWECAR